MKICCIVETPYQLINALNLLINDKEFNDASVDLFIRDNHFSSSTEIYHRIKRLKLFREVHLFSINYNLSNCNIINHIRNIPKFAFAAKTLSQSVGNGYKYIRNHYDTILTPNGCSFFKFATVSNPKATVYCFEDGLLSYGKTNWVENAFSPASKLLVRLLTRNNKYCPQRVYLNNPEFFQKSWDVEVRQLPPLKAALSAKNSVFANIFGAPACNYSETRFVYLSQPISDNISQQIAEQISCEYITRYHPRDKESLKLGSIHDRSSSQWELICASDITDRHVLIGACSTAQIVPKWFFNTEPFLVFTYPLFADSTNDNFKQISKDVVDKTKKIYQDPSKIFVVHSFEELCSVLNSISDTSQ